jgi:hypothetical protein
MKAIIFSFCIFSFLFSSCTPERVNLKFIDNGDLVNGVYNSIECNIGDTVLYQTTYRSEDPCASESSFTDELVTNEEWAQKQRVIWHYGNTSCAGYEDWVKKRLSVRKAIVVE